MSAVLPLRELDVSGRRVLLRADLNVPLADGQITSDARIRAVLPTVRHLVDQGAAVVMCSHLGRPKGKPDPAASLEPVAVRLSELVRAEVVLADDCVGDGVRALMKRLDPEQILVLENLRFHAGETANTPEFVRRLVAPFDLERDIYVNDAFGACHRAHASVVGVPQQFPRRAAGFLLERELSALVKLLDAPARPFVAVVGGAKVSDKIGVLSSLLDRVSALCIGGAMAYTFLRARGVEVGRSRVEEPQLATAREFLTRAERRGVAVSLPVDHVVAKDFDANAPSRTVGEANMATDDMALDIGPHTRAAFAEIIDGARTVFWNGPMGVFEWDAFAAGTMAVAESVAACDGFTVVGGGDSVAAIEKAGVVDRIGHVSTGGGASLELLQHGSLPGVEALRGAKTKTDTDETDNDARGEEEFA